MLETRRTPPLLALLLAILALAPARAHAAQAIHVVVTVPADTPADASVYLAGSLDSVGKWKADGVKLDRQSDGTYAAVINVDPGQTLEFKITRGSWQTVEQGADGTDRPNRVVHVDDSTKEINVTVVHWAGSTAAKNGNANGAIRVVVAVPADTPADASIYLAGSLDSVGKWKADGVKLDRQSDGTYAADIDAKPGERLEFKITRGSWQTVERNADNSDRPNRVTDIDASTKQLDVTVARWASGDAAKRPSTVQGMLRTQEIDSKFLAAKRTIRVWLPPDYETNTDATYPVLYMHDGQNCFDAATSSFGVEWQIDETMTALIAAKKITPMIVVGIDNGGDRRMDEYTYEVDSTRGSSAGGDGANYARFMLEEVMPLVEKTFRVRPGRESTFMGGSSLGGLISLEIARRNPGKFAGIIAMSPAIWWANQSLATAVETDAGGLAGTRIWLDMGTREAAQLDPGDNVEARGAKFVKQVQRLDEALTKQNVPHRLTIVQGGEHNEANWAKRFGDAIQYIVNGD